MENKKSSIYFRQEEAQIKPESKDKKLIIRGYPILFNVGTSIYRWDYGHEVEEKISRNALDGVDLSEVYLVLGHSSHPSDVLALTGANMRLEVDEVGVFFEATLPNTQTARDTYNLIEEGIIRGMSFGFTIQKETYDKLTHEVTIDKIDSVREITITPYPAYKETLVITDVQKQEIVEKSKIDASSELEKQKKLLESFI
jgi:HK97 family phage prohead protease